MIKEPNIPNTDKDKKSRSGGEVMDGVLRRMLTTPAEKLDQKSKKSGKKDE